MKLSEHPELVNWPETHYVYIEKVGPFLTNAPEAWKEFQKFIPQIAQNSPMTGFMSLYKPKPQIYRAGVSVASEPRNVPEGLKYEKFKGGKYTRFVLTGPYSQLPDASRRVSEIVKEKKIQLRDDYWIENYVNDPRTTPEGELITEILAPGT